MPLVGPDGIRLSDKQTEAWKLLEDRTHTEVFFGGGAGSSKSTTGCLWQIWRRVKYPGTRGFIGRETYRELADSTVKTFFEVMSAMGYGDAEFTYNAQDDTVYWKNGSETHFRYMQSRPSDPDFHRFGSTEYTDAFVDEAPGVNRRAVEILNSRLRFKHVEYDLIPKTLLTGNPGDHWVKEEYVFDKYGKPVELPAHRAKVLATIEDHPDRDFAARYKKTLQHRDEYDRRRLLDGDWLIGPRTGMEFFPDFDSKKHVRENAYDPRRALHITFDFNTSPYMTLLVSQIKQKEMGRWAVDFLGEYCPEHPLSTPKAACMKLKRDLKEGKFAGHDAGLFVYGDRSGKSNKTGESEVVMHDFDVVFTELAKWVDNRSDRVMRSNPPHAKAREFMGHCFSGRLPVDITFDPSMHNTISDHLHLKQGPDGGILKEYAVDQVTKAKYEKHGHCAQAAYYEVISAFKDMYDDMGSLAA